VDRGHPPEHALGSRALPPVDQDTWELYGTTSDWSQAHDVAAEQPELLDELKRLFLIEAVRYGVLPLDDRRVERFNPDLAGRPTLILGNRQLLFAGTGRLTESSLLNVKNKSHAVTRTVLGARGRGHRRGTPAGRRGGTRPAAERSALGDDTVSDRYTS
jgi:hypothetical protein